MPTKGKDVKKIVQEGIREDLKIKMGISLESNILETEVIFL